MANETKQIPVVGKVGEVPTSPRAPLFRRMAQYFHERKERKMLVERELRLREMQESLNRKLLSPLQWWGWHMEEFSGLLKAGADPNAKGNCNCTSCRCPMLVKVGRFYDPGYPIGTDKLTEMAKLLIEAGADINATNEDKQTPLMMFAKAGNAEIVRILIGRGADLNLRGDCNDITGADALTLAACGGHTEIIKMLIEAGVDPDSRSPKGVTALMRALYYGQLESVVCLVQAGADPSVKDNSGRSVRDYQCSFTGGILKAFINRCLYEKDRQERRAQDEKQLREKCAGV